MRNERWLAGRRSVKDFYTQKRSTSGASTKTLIFNAPLDLGPRLASHLGRSAQLDCEHSHLQVFAAAWPCTGWRMNVKLLKGVATASVLLAGISAAAFPIASTGDGLLVIASGVGSVKATYQGNSASYSNDLYLENTGTFVFNNHSNSPGDMVDLGMFTAGTELRFRLHVNDTGDDFFSGPGSRNADGSAHARVETNGVPGETLVSFEDLINGPFDFNDLSFSFTNTASGPSVPEPTTMTLLLAGLAFVGVQSRRKAQK